MKSRILLAAAGVLVHVMASTHGAAALPDRTEARPEPRDPTSVPGYEVISRTSQGDSTGSKTIGALCPTGKVVLGGGAYIYPEHPKLFLTRLEPYLNVWGYGFKATAEEGLAGYSGNWSISVVAICADRPPAYELTGWSADTTSVTTQSIVQSCPAGAETIGAGGYVTGQQGATRLTAVHTESLGGARAQGARDPNAPQGTWTVGVVAICAELRVQEGWEDSAISSASSRTARMDCLPGQKVIGGGFSTRGLIDTYPWPNVTFGYSLPSWSPFGPDEPPFHFVLAHEDPTTSESWYIRANVYCVS